MRGKNHGNFTLKINCLYRRVRTERLQEMEWGTYFDTPSTTGTIVGSQSMQLRWYNTTSSSSGYTFINFNNPNVTRVTFNAVVLQVLQFIIALMARFQVKRALQVLCIRVILL